jgi:hypothetical protein
VLKRAGPSRAGRSGIKHASDANTELGRVVDVPWTSILGGYHVGLQPSQSSKPNSQHGQRARRSPGEGRGPEAQSGRSMQLVAGVPLDAVGKLTWSDVCVPCSETASTALFACDSISTTVHSSLPRRQLDWFRKARQAIGRFFQPSAEWCCWPTLGLRQTDGTCGWIVVVGLYMCRSDVRSARARRVLYWETPHLFPPRS